MKKHLKSTLLISTVLLLASITLVMLCACNRVWGKDETAKDPGYVYNGDDLLHFTLELRTPGSGTEISDGDNFPHATIDGELITSWQVPYYGNTVYESVVKFFEDRSDNIDFRLSQHKFQMFHSCTLESGETYNLERSYIAANGKYSMCANFEKLLGDDNTLGTVDDLDVLVVVYDGWMY